MCVFFRGGPRFFLFVLISGLRVKDVEVVPCLDGYRRIVVYSSLIKAYYAGGSLGMFLSTVLIGSNPSWAKFIRIQRVNPFQDRLQRCA